MAPLDPVALAQALIRRPSVTPADAGAMDVVEAALVPLGFVCRRMRFNQTENIYARRGIGGPNLCFGGHTDVVPPGDMDAWTHDPFAGALAEGELHGRGAVDMKSAVAAFIAAAASTREPEGERGGSLSLIVTGDEEGSGYDGARRVVEALLAEGERIDHCLVGEPTSSAVLGDMVKVGRRGSVNAVVTVEGRQGHVAYPHRAANPVPVLIRLLNGLLAERLDEGFPEFQSSNLEVTDLEVGNPAHNVIAARASARLNVRFNPNWRAADIVARLEAACRAAEDGFDGGVRLAPRISGEAFYTEPGPFVTLVAEAVRAATGREPELSTSGGTSDARYFRALCPVVEFGLVGATMHMVDERTAVADIHTLTRIYEGVISRYFETFRER